MIGAVVTESADLSRKLANFDHLRVLPNHLIRLNNYQIAILTHSTRQQQAMRGSITCRIQIQLLN